MATKESERRDGPRIDLRLRVRYEGAGGSGEAEASDISPKGLRIESDHPVEVGSEMKLHVDAGEAEELEAMGYVAWCRGRASPTGKTMYDVGVRFESDWLAKDRGPLGSALARVFAMNAYEPARNYERTPVSLKARTVDEPPVDLEIANLSLGGMQLRSSGSVGDRVRAGQRVQIAVDVPGATHHIVARIAWVAGQRDAGSGGPRVSDTFGVDFGEVSPAERTFLDKIRTGQVDPIRITLSID